MRVRARVRTPTWPGSRRVLMMGTGCGGDYEITFYNRSAREFLIKLSRDNTHTRPARSKSKRVVTIIKLDRYSNNMYSIHYTVYIILTDSAVSPLHRFPDTNDSYNYYSNRSGSGWRSIYIYILPTYFPGNSQIRSDVFCRGRMTNTKGRCNVVLFPGQSAVYTDPRLYIIYCYVCECVPINRGTVGRRLHCDRPDQQWCAWIVGALSAAYHKQTAVGGA